MRPCVWQARCTCNDRLSTVEGSQTTAPPTRALGSVQILAAEFKHTMRYRGSLRVSVRPRRWVKYTGRHTVTYTGRHTVRYTGRHTVRYTGRHTVRYTGTLCFLQISQLLLHAGSGI